MERIASLRESINKTLDKVRSLADGVFFEFGSSRQHDLVLRSQIVRWQPQLRMIFITRIALLKYRLSLSGFELPKGIRTAQVEFDEWIAQLLDGMANRFEGKASPTNDSHEFHVKDLEETIPALPPEREKAPILAHTQTFISLSRSIETQTTSLDKEI